MAPRDIVGDGRAEFPPPRPLCPAGATSARDAADYRGVAFVVLFSLLALGWLLLIRNVRAGMPVAPLAPRREAAVNGPPGGAVPPLALAARQESVADRPD
ncbi:MAG: hypothetical protein U0790_20100 [Isosphaeraceae bacterium]